MIAFATLVFTSLLAMVNPFGALPIFVGLTGDPRCFGSSGRRGST